MKIVLILVLFNLQSGSEVIVEGTMIAYDADGNTIGMYSCSPSKTGKLNEFNPY